MKKLVFMLLATGLFAGCASSESQMKAALEKNPEIVFNAIEKNPAKFMEVVNRAAQAAQVNEYERQMNEMKAEQEKDLKSPKKPKLSDDRRIAGTESGKIVVVEYADFQCPACRMAYDSLKQFKEKYKGQVQFYYKNMPLDFHKMAMPAAQYFEAIRLQDKAKALKFYEYVFQNQRKLASDGFLKAAAKSVGADMARLEKDIKSDAVKKLIEEDMAEFSAFGFTGTPVMIVNGVALNGAQRLEELVRVAELTMKK